MSTKKLIKRIVTSSVYQLGNLPERPSLEQDPTNSLLHYHPLRRLDGESLRDSILTVANRIDLAMSGPPVRFMFHPMLMDVASQPAGRSMEMVVGHFICRFAETFPTACCRRSIKPVQRRHEAFDQYRMFPRRHLRSLMTSSFMVSVIIGQQWSSNKNVRLKRGFGPCSSRRMREAHRRRKQNRQSHLSVLTPTSAKGLRNWLTSLSTARSSYFNHEAEPEHG